MGDKCVLSSDCTVLNENNEEIIRFCYSEMYGRAEENFCACSGLYGFVGDECDEYTVQSYWFGILAFFLLLGSIVGLIWVVYITCLNFSLMCEVVRGVRKETHKRILVLLITFVFIELLIDIGRRALDFSFFINPRRVSIVEIQAIFDEQDTFELIMGPLGGLSLFLISLSLLFGCLSTLVVVLSWLSIVEKMSDFFDSSEVATIVRIRKFTLVSYSFIGVVAVSLTVIGQLSLAGILLSIIVLSTIFLVFYARRLFMKCIKKYSNDEKMFDKATKIIKLFSKWYIRAYFIYFLLIVCQFFIGSNENVKIPPGRFNYPGLFLDFARIGKFFLQFPTLFYVQQLLSVNTN